MKTNKPDRKIISAGATGIIATGIVFALGQFGYEMSSEVAAGVVTALMLVVGYFISDPRVQAAIAIIEAQTDGD